MTPTPDTSPAAVEAMCERLDVFEDWLYAMDMAGLSEVQPNLHDTAAMLREMAMERDRYRELASTTHRANMVSMGEADKLKDRIEAAEAEAAMLRRERDEARDQFDHHVVWASDQSAKLEAEAAALRGHIQKAYRALAHRSAALPDLLTEITRQREVIEAWHDIDRKRDAEIERLREAPADVSELRWAADMLSRESIQCALGIEEISGARCAHCSDTNMRCFQIGRVREALKPFCVAQDETLVAKGAQP